jgi:hypothetical protein
MPVWHEAPSVSVGEGAEVSMCNREPFDGEGASSRMREDVESTDVLAAPLAICLVILGDVTCAGFF